LKNSPFMMTAPNSLAFSPRPNAPVQRRRASDVR
jgi:hypothetical protein